MVERRKPTIDSRIERQIITGLIISTEFIKEITPIFKTTSLTLPFAKIVARWCLDYYGEFEEAPGKHIQDIFISHRDEMDEAVGDLTEEFLTNLSKEYEREVNFNVGYIVKKAEEYLRQQSIRDLRDTLSQDLVGGRTEEAEARVANFTRLVRPRSMGINPINDREAIIRAFDQDSGELLFRMPGDLGRMIGTFERGWFVIIVGPMKRGKTWWLQEVALRGLFAGLNVLFVSLEMSETQMTRRIQHNLTGLPTKRWSGEMEIPTFNCKRKPICRDAVEGPFCTLCRGGKEFTPVVHFETMNKQALTTEKALTKGAALTRSLLRGASFKLIDPPAGSINFSDLKVMLDNWEHYEGWIPDVIVTDYSDKFKAEPHASKEYRHRIYETIVAHKAMAIERNILMVSGSQSNTGREEEKNVGSGDFAEDIRKRAEVDVAWSLNQTPVEKTKGIMRVRMMAQRHDFYDTSQECMVLQNFKIGKPYLDSILIK